MQQIKSMDAADQQKELNMRDKFARLLINQYLAGKHPPWSSAYLLHRQEYISKTLANTQIMSVLRVNQTLPPRYGIGLDERCIEYPWLFSQLNERPEHILDAGSALNHAFILDQPIWQHKKLHILTLVPEQNCHWNQGISYLYEDLRRIPIRDDYYDTVVCISTLEHIGADNRKFNVDSDHNDCAGDYTTAMSEMHRVLKSSGRLLLTVPFGRYKDTGTQFVFNEDLLEQAIAAFEAKEVMKTLYGYTRQGWQVSDIDECKDYEYVEWNMLPAERRPSEFPIQPDGATAARAVVCITLKKNGR